MSGCSSLQPIPQSSVFPSHVLSYHASPTSSSFPSPLALIPTFKTPLHYSYHSFITSPPSPQTFVLLEYPIVSLLPFIFLPQPPGVLKERRISNPSPMSLLLIRSAILSSRYRLHPAPSAATNWLLSPFLSVMNLMLPLWTLITGNAADHFPSSMDMNEGMQWGQAAERGRPSDFDFENSRVKPWEGERIHEVGVDELELTLGCGKA
ncbi:hypothetical protein HN51_052895 [Arachis hypogaea]